MLKRFYASLITIFLCLLLSNTQVFAISHLNYIAAPDTITLYGTNFIPASQVRLNGGAVQTIYISPTVLKAVVPSGTPVGQYPMTVFNPAQGGGTSGVQNLNIISVSDSSLALQYIYQTRQTTFTLIDSSRATMVSPRDSVLWWVQATPITVQNAVDMRVSIDGNYTMTINDLNDDVSETPQVKKMIFHSQDSTLTCFDKNNAQVSALKMTNFGVFNLKPLIDSLRTANGTTIFNGIVPGGTGGITMTQYASNEASNGATISDIDATHKQIIRSASNGFSGISFPANASIISVVNTQLNLLETMTIRDNTTLLPILRTTLLYTNIAGTSVLRAIVSEAFDTLSGGTPIKIVNVVEYDQMRYSNYLR